MKKLFTVGLAQCFGSIIPVIVWTVAGKLHNDAFANGMTFTYPYQFVFLLLWHITFIGNIKHELKGALGTRNYGRTSILVGLFVGIVIVCISIWNVEIIGSFLGITENVDKWAFVFGLGSMAIDWPAYYCGEQYQYYGEEKKGTRMIVSWYVMKLVLVLITALPVFDYKSATIFILSVQALMLIILVIKHSIPEKLQFSICNGMKYSIHDMFYCIFMGVIYLFGIHDMSSTDTAFLTAFNLMVLCTDTQWDVCGSAIDVTVTTDICNGNFDRDRRKIFRNNILFSLIMVVTSYIMLGVMLLLYKDINPAYALIMTAIELSTMIPYGIIDTMTAYISVEHPSIWIGVLTILKYTVRISCQFIIPSPYAINIALPVAVLVDLPFRILLYRIARKKAKV